MAVYTVKVKARPRPARTKIRRRLKGVSLTAAKAARKYLSGAIRHDERLKARPDGIAANRLIFLGDADVEGAVNDLIDTLDEAIGSTVKTVTVR